MGSSAAIPGLAIPGRAIPGDAVSAAPLPEFGYATAGTTVPAGVHATAGTWS